MVQKSLIDICLLSVDLFSDVLYVRVRRGAELLTDHHLVVCYLGISKPVPSRISRKRTATYKIKWKALEDNKMRKQFVSILIAHIRQLPNESEDIEKE